MNQIKRILLAVVMSFLLFFFGNHAVLAQAKTGKLSTLLPCTSWDFASDFRTSPDQENPNRDSCNNPDAWSFMVSTGLTQDPQTYSLASYFTTNLAGGTG